MIHALIPTYLTVRMWAASAGIGLAQTAALYYAPWLSIPMFVLTAQNYISEYTWDYPTLERWIKNFKNESKFIPEASRLIDYQNLVTQQTDHPASIVVMSDRMSFGYYNNNILVPFDQFLLLDTKNSAVLKMLKSIIGHELAHRFYLSYSSLSRFSIKLFNVLKFEQNIEIFAVFALINILFQKYWVDRNKKEEDKRSVFQICKSVLLGALKFIVLQCVSVLLSYALSRAVETACDYASFMANGMFGNSLAAYYNFCTYSWYSDPIKPAVEEATRAIEACMASDAVLTVYAPSWREWLDSWFDKHPSLHSRCEATGQNCAYAF